MNNWTIMAPYLRARLQGDTARAAEAIGKLPGVKQQRNGDWHIPLNAARTAVEHLSMVGGAFHAIGWVNRNPPATWDTVKSALEASPVRSWVLDFMTQYQRDATTFAWSRRGCLFIHPTGSGKTLSGILASMAVPHGVTIVVTRSASKIQYAREIERFVATRAYVVRAPSSHTMIRVNGESFHQFRGRYKGSGKSNKEVGTLWKAHQTMHGIDRPQSLSEYLEARRAAGEKPFVVLGWEALSDNIDALKGLHIGCVIFDESHRGKDSKRWDTSVYPQLPDDPIEAGEVAAKQLAEAKARQGFIKENEEGERLLFLPRITTATCAAELSRLAQKTVLSSATPVKDRVRDLWAQLDLAEPNAWGNATAWLDRYAARRPGTYGGFDTTGASNLLELKERMSTLCHILKYTDTHRHLPPKRRESVYIAPEDQNAASAGFAKEMREAAKFGPTAILEVRLAEAASRKRNVALTLISGCADAGQKVTVFTGRKRDCESLGELLKKELKGTDVWWMHGGFGLEDRQRIIDEYMAHPGPCVLVATGQSAGESINLDTTDNAFFLMLPYTPGELTQWEGRFHRASTKKPILITYVIAENTVDEHCADILISKMPAVEKMTDDDALSSATSVLAGYKDQTPEQFALEVLSYLEGA